MIDAAGALALLERVVAERGEDYFYLRPDGSTRCLYVHEGPNGPIPGCGIGLAATYAGVSLETLAEWDRAGDVWGIRQVLFDNGGLTVLDAFQRRQDRGVRYGAALDAARAQASHLSP